MVLSTPTFGVDTSAHECAAYHDANDQQQRTSVRRLGVRRGCAVSRVVVASPPLRKQSIPFFNLGSEVPRANAALSRWREGAQSGRGVVSYCGAGGICCECV